MKAKPSIRVDIWPQIEQVQRYYLNRFDVEAVVRFAKEIYKRVIGISNDEGAEKSLEDEIDLTQLMEKLHVDDKLRYASRVKKWDNDTKRQIQEYLRQRTEEARESFLMATHFKSWKRWTKRSNLETKKDKLEELVQDKQRLQEQIVELRKNLEDVTNSQGEIKQEQRVEELEEQIVVQEKANAEQAEKIKILQEQIRRQREIEQQLSEQSTLQTALFKLMENFYGN